MQAVVQETLHGHLSHSLLLSVCLPFFFLALSSLVPVSLSYSWNTTLRWKETGTAAVAVGSSIFFSLQRTTLPPCNATPHTYTTHVCMHAHTHNFPVLIAFFLIQLGRCFLKQVCVTGVILVFCRWNAGGACVCKCVFACVENNIVENEMWSAGWIWVSKVQMVPLLLPHGGIFKTVLHSLAIYPLFSLSSTTAPLGLAPAPCCAYWNLSSQLSYWPIRKAFTKAPANWISATFPCQMRL